MLESLLSIFDLVDIEVLRPIDYVFVGSIAALLLFNGISSYVSRFFIFKKMGLPSIYAAFPIYNRYLLYKHTWEKLWAIPLISPLILGLLGTFVPALSDTAAFGILTVLFVLTLFAITNHLLYKGFDKSLGFCIMGLVFVLVAQPICAFGQETYVDPIGWGVK